MKNKGDIFRADLTRRGFGGLVGGAAAFTALGPIAGGAAAQGTPKKGGVIRVATHAQSTNDTFNSAKFVFSNDYMRGTCTYNTLTTPDTQAEAKPSLAESWEPTNGGKSWVFKLVKGVTFHDGSPMTTDDVIYSIMRHKDEKLASSARAIAMNIERVVADGPNAIRIDLVRPDADFPIVIGTFQFTIVKNGTVDFSKPIGTGPFRVKDFRPGVMTVGERNPNYWRDGHPYVDGYELFGIVDHVARVNALLAGDVHMVSSVRGAGIQQVEKADNAQIFKTEAPYYLAFQSALDMAPMNNHDLRLGLAYLLDRKRFIDVVLKGYGSMGNDHPFMTNSPYYNSSLPQRELDLDKAKFHLTKSGIGKSPIDLHVSDVAPYSVDLAQLVQREAARAGFNLNIRREPGDSYWNTIPGNRAFFANVLNPRPTYGMLLNLTWKSGVPWNYSHFSDKTMDSLIDQAQESLDPNVRKRLYGDIQKIIHDLAAKIIPAHIYFIDGVSNKVKGLTPVPVGNLGGFNWGDSVWIDS